HQDLDAPVERFLPISFIGNVKLFNLQVDPACGRLPFQGLDLGIDLDCGDYIESLPRKSHCGLMSKARACSCNQNPLHLFSPFVAHLTTAVFCCDSEFVQSAIAACTCVFPILSKTFTALSAALRAEAGLVPVVTRPAVIE